MSEHTQVDGIYPLPAVMQTRTIETNGASIHVRVGGHGPAVVMLHGFGTTGDMWGHLASALIEEHMVVAPDLRGLGLSATAAWKTKPSWSVIASNDRAVPFEHQKAEAAVMKATSITVASSHVPMLSHPKEVADLIEQAAAKAGNR
jgi:pimeloyl-ACP methyl ester carboxylesterase